MLGVGWAAAIAIVLQSPAPSPAPAARWPDSRPITHFVQNLGRDLESLPSRNNSVLLAAGAAAAAWSHSSDARAARWAASLGPSSATPVGRVIGNGWTQWAAAGGTYAIGRLTGSAAATHVGGDLIRAQALVGLLTEGLKVSIRRTRPSGGRWSFPSGHTSASVATAAVLESNFGWRVGVPAYAAAAFVGWSRVRDNQHWVSDVVFGVALGAIAGRTVASHGRRPPVAIVPTAGRGGGILIVWSPAVR